MSDNKKAAPFSRAYVIGTTLRHMEASIDLSITKTHARIPEFVGNQEKGNEALMTLDALHRMRRMLDEFRQHNPSLLAE
jgi:hypothetical protein